MPAKSIAAGTGIAMPKSYKTPESGLKNLSFDEWAILLKEFPQFAPRYNWRMLRPENWQKMPFVPQQFSASLDWVRTNGANWAKILNENPDLFREKCDWSNLHGLNWAWLLRWKPEFADLCDWRKLQDSHWGWLLERHPEFKWIKFDVLQSFKHNSELPGDCDWDQLGHNEKNSSYKFLDIPKKRDLDKSTTASNNAKRISLVSISDVEWANRYRNECFNHDVYGCVDGQLDRNRFSGEQMALWLRYNYKLARAIDWQRLDGSDWVALLRWAPYLAIHCNWAKLDGNDWAVLLSFYHEFADYCDWDKTKEWTGHDWALLLRHEPKLATNERLSKMNGDDLVVVLSKQPALAKVCNIELLNGSDWVSLLCKQPQLACACDWSKMSSANWGDLLETQPQFADKCDWHNKTGYELVNILIKSRVRVQNYLDIGNLYELTGVGEDAHSRFVEFLLASCDLENDNSVFYNLSQWNLVWDVCDKCDWNRLSEQDKLWLVRKFYKRQHLKWEELNGEEIFALLRSFPELAEKCDLDKLSISNWVDLIDIHPKLGNCCNHLNDEIVAEKQHRIDAKKKHREEDECECIDDNDNLDDQEPYYVDGVPVYGADDQEDAEIQYWNTH